MKSILIGATIYGWRYVDVFLKYCLPSLMTYGNFPALKEQRNIILVIHSDAQSLARLAKEMVLPEYITLKCVVDITGEDKYIQLGKHQHDDLKMAKSIGADYHLLMPDFVYSENCFSGVLKCIKNGHTAIARLIISTTQETICPLIKSTNSASDLATLSLLHIHPGISHWFATKEGFPNNHVVMWEGENTLHMCSPHCSPVYIANEAINIDSSYASLDAILDKIVVGDIYCPRPDDGIVIIELTPYFDRARNDIRVDLKEFCRIFKWDTGNSLQQFKIFDAETIDPIDRTKLGDKFLNDIEIITLKSIITEAIKQNMG